MATVTESNGVVNFDQTLTDTRALWREAVTTVAEKAKATLPQCNGRVDKAMAIVLNGDVELLPDGKARVASQSNGTTEYVICNGVCECKDFPKAPSGWCKHRIAAGMQKRAIALMQRTLATSTITQPEAPSQPTPAPLPEAPASVNVRLVVSGREVQWTLRDTDEARLAARLAALLARYPVTEAPTSPAPAPAAQPTPEGWCVRHGVQMKLNHGKDGRQWWSHRVAEGGWCKGR